MNYYIVEGTPDGEYNATNKAREDVEQILNECGISKLIVDSKYGVQRNKCLKWKQFIFYKMNIYAWRKTLSRLNAGDVIFIQYPILNTTIGLNRALAKHKKRGVIFVAIIHDLDSLRFDEKSKNTIRYKRVLNDDRRLLGTMNYIISHNRSMKRELTEEGIDESRIFTLGIFDYLVDNGTSSFIEKKHGQKYEGSIIIAGNLSPCKAKYLSEIKKLDNKFNLYGAGLEKSVLGKNTKYCGKFKPEELLRNLSGDFGLVWDGDSIDTCNGRFGNYLKYNNPHKASMYLTAGIPIIVWRESALREFVEKNNVGISVDSLYDLRKIDTIISDKQYKIMKDNALRISKQTRRGFYLQKAVDKVLHDITRKG